MRRLMTLGSSRDPLRRFRAKLASADRQQVVVTVLGTSISWGAYANADGTQTIDDTQFRVNGYVPILRSLFAGRYGDVGEGVIQGDNARVAVVGTTSNNHLGFAATDRGLIDTTTSVTWSLPACTTIVIYAWWASGSGAFNYQIDGGSVVASAASSGTDTLYKVTVTGLADATHTLVLTPKGGGASSFIAGVSALRDTTKGVVVHRTYKSGGYLDDFVHTTPATSQIRDLALYFGQTNADLAIFEFGANESSSTGQTAGKTPAAFAALMETATRYVTDTLGKTALIIAGPRQDVSRMGPINEEAYYQAIRAVALRNPNCAFFDLALEPNWASYVQGNAAGLYRDQIHPTKAGHLDFGTRFFNYVTGS